MLWMPEVDRSWKARRRRALVRLAPAWQAAGTAVITGGATDATVTWPTHAAGDVAILLVTQRNPLSTDPGAATLTTANGFVAVASASVASTSGSIVERITAFYCLATSSSMASPVVKGPTGTTTCALILTVRGADPLNPVDQVATSASNASNSSVTATGVTTTAANELVIIAVGNSGSARSASGWTNANLSGLTERADESSSSPCLAAATGTIATIGATGNTTATLSGSTVWAALTLSIRGPSGGTGLLLLGVG